MIIFQDQGEQTSVVEDFFFFFFVARDYTWMYGTWCNEKWMR